MIEVAIFAVRHKAICGHTPKVRKQMKAFRDPMLRVSTRVIKNMFTLFPNPHS